MQALYSYNDHLKLFFVSQETLQRATLITALTPDGQSKTPQISKNIYCKNHAVSAADWQASDIDPYRLFSLIKLVV